MLTKRREESGKTCICGKQRGTDSKRGKFMDKPEKKYRKTVEPDSEKKRKEWTAYTRTESGSSKSNINRGALAVPHLMRDKALLWCS